jgi:hypothetical protein
MSAVIESDTRIPGAPMRRVLADIARPVTLNDHLTIETEGAISPIQREISRLSIAAERRKVYLLERQIRDGKRINRLYALIRRTEARIGSTRAELDELR